MNDVMTQETATDAVHDLAPDAEESSLPRPRTDRWQPLRLGLVDLFYYDDEQFWFHDGRLLLRGNNGTGKSKVLALTLPFLLDGSTAPRRVEPDADPRKRMDWNLLLGGAHGNSERTGYSWVEFGRVDPDGTEHFTTLGIGLKAAAGRGIVKSWYFVTTRRIGELALLDDRRTVLSQERLRDELADGGAGQVYTRQESYRRAVDEALFQLGEERYAALIDLLIQLRQPQLSKKPDEKALSAALTEALAPLDQAIVADVAESFRSLEEERTGIADAKETLSATEDFLRHYRDYARVAARRHTTAVRLANSAFEHAGRDLREAEEQYGAAGDEIVRLDEQYADAGEHQGGLRGREQALKTSPEMRDAARLNDASVAASELEHRAEAAGSEAEQAAGRAQQDADDVAAALRTHQDAVSEENRRVADAARRATGAGLVAEHATIVRDGDAAERTLARRRDQAVHVRGLVNAAQRAHALADQRRQTLDAAQGEQASRAEMLHSAHDAVSGAVMSYRDAVRSHVSALTIIAIDGGVEEIAESAEAWAHGIIGESPVLTAVESATRAASDRIGTQRAEAQSTEQRVVAELSTVEAEIASLEAGRDPEPTPALTRNQAAREDWDGAPLWRLTDFVATSSAELRAGAEAALHSAGLLDAWIFPDGTVCADGDVVLGPTGLKASPSLATMLVPAAGPEAGIDEETVNAVLSRIGWGEESGAALWVDGEGQWGAGPARGAWSKARAEFVGAGAREAHRQAVLVGLRVSADELGIELYAARDVIADCVRRSEQVKIERAGYPAGAEREVVSAHGRAASAQQEADRAGERAVAAEAEWESAAGVAAQAADELAEKAEQLGIGTTADDVERLLLAISSYAEALTEVRAAARSAQSAAIARDGLSERAAETATIRDRRAGEYRELRARAVEKRATFEELQATVGASVAELQSQLEQLAEALDLVAKELTGLIVEQREAAAVHGRLGQRVRDLEQRREEMSQRREERVVALRAFAETGLLRVADSGLLAPGADAAEEWTVTAAVALSRSAEQLLHAADESDEAWARIQQRVSGASTELARQMSRHGHESFIEQRGDVLVARVRYLHDEVDIDQLAERLADDVADRERLLSAREREVLENHLVNEVAGHLHELLLSAEGQIDRMNRELAERKTSTGMQLRMRWRERADAPAGLSAVRSLMIRSDATWTEADRTAIGDFLQVRIAEARAADPTGGWQEHLEQVLDYRQWHAFAIERQQNGRWQSASGPASGGERVLAVSVPLFAAASAHYNSADPRSPRLILLDEAFAGVDDDSRAKSLGLLATFDLDVVMTSEREWGCYPQVPGLSIAQLSRMEGIDAVGVTRWRWDGRRKQPIPEVDATARAGGGVLSPPADADESGLF